MPLDLDHPDPLLLLLLLLPCCSWFSVTQRSIRRATVMNAALGACTRLDAS